MTIENLKLNYIGRLTRCPSAFETPWRGSYPEDKQKKPPGTIEGWYSIGEPVLLTEKFKNYSC